MIVTLKNVDAPFLNVIESLLQLRKDVYMETSEEEPNDLTAKVMAESEAGKNLSPIYKNTSDFMAALNAWACPEACYDLSEFEAIVNKLRNREELDPKYKDHQLSNNWKNHRDFHLHPDLVVICRIQENELILEMVRMGTHSNLFKK